MATIRKRGETYQIRVSLGYDANNKQIEKSLTWKPTHGMTEKQIKKELARVALEFENKIQNGEMIDAKNLRLSQFCDQYLDMVDDNLAPNTKHFYTRIINDYIKPSLGNLKLNQIKPVHVQQFILTLSTEGGRKDGKGEKISPATVKRYFTVLKSIMARAYRLDLIEHNPTETAKLDLPKVIEPDIAIFTKEEAAYMLSCLEKEPTEFKLLIHLAIVTGLRRGELAALSWDCIDFENKSLTVKQSAYKPIGKEIALKPPKTRGSVRSIAIPEYLIALLRHYKVEQSERRLKLGSKWEGNNWIFTQWNGKIINPMTPTKWWTHFLERHNIPHRKFHSLRHTSATLLLANGANIKTVASRLGHSQLKTTDRYVHALQDADQAAAQTFETIFNQQFQSL